MINPGKVTLDDVKSTKNRIITGSDENPSAGLISFVTETESGSLRREIIKRKTADVKKREKKKFQFKNGTKNANASYVIERKHRGSCGGGDGGG